MMLRIFTLVMICAISLAAAKERGGAEQPLLPLRLALTETPEMLVAPMPAAGDSGIVEPQRKLLPEKMSFAERGLWGESGLMRTLGVTSELTPQSRKNELTARRTMLGIHQIGGFVTLGLMMGAAYCGQKMIDGDYTYLRTHKALVSATILSYSTTGLLSVLSPPPLIRRSEMSTTTIHKLLAWVHFTGMVVTPILGKSISHSTNTDIRRVHQISAYVTTAALASSLIVITF
jgi:hypothetical protein